MKAELVGPLPSVRFYDGSSVAYTPPLNTLDDRYVACVHHRVACDCREAEIAEDRAEWRAEHKAVEDAFNTVLHGHQTWVFTDAGRDEAAECKCTGCQIVRLVDYGYRSSWRVIQEREAAGLSGIVGRKP